MIVAVEGPCCAGKTTLSRGLLKALPQLTIAHVRCYADFAGGGRHLPDPVPRTLAEDAAGLQELVRLERARTDAALRSDSDLILLDRGAHTLLAHRYAIEQVTGLKCFGPARRAVAEERLPTWPDLVLYLDIPQESVHERNRGKFPHDSIFIEAKFNAGIRSYYTGITGEQDIVWLDATLEPYELVTLAEASVSHLLTTAAADQEGLPREAAAAIGQGRLRGLAQRSVARPVLDVDTRERDASVEGATRSESGRGVQ
ncbi:hypothetical protein ABZ793_24085 [Micromonospora sp. NPDC047465]|uniref:hypothetical protein n=1 Tax=Micromonospora sp. NPDC047465 TaxID=3154813 RepID=UPI003406D894